MKISGCIITKNEEENIANCINSLKQVTDEIIVVDTGSEDNTVSIAAGLGAAVYEHPWENDFSKAKNKALEYAKGDWVIFLDADEYFSQDSLPKVRSVIQNAHSDRKADGILSEIEHIDKDTGKFIGSDEILRIFRNNSKFRYVNKIHEEIRNNGVPLNCMDERGKLIIVHTGYSAAIRSGKAERNLKIMLENPDTEKSDYYSATTYFVLRDFENAYKYAELALASDEIAGSWMAYKLHLIKIYVAMNSQESDKDKIRKLIEEAKQKHGEHPEIMKIEADYLFGEKLYRNALEKYHLALDSHAKYGMTFSQNDFQGALGEVYFNIGQIMFLMNREADALDSYVKALRADKYHANAFRRMFALFRSIPETETIAFINSIYHIDNKSDVGFVVGQIADCGRPKIVLYYAGKWNNVFEQEDDVLIYAFLSQGNYRNALEIAQLFLEIDREKYAPLTAAVIILGRLFSENEKLRTVMGNDYSEIVRCFGERAQYSGSREAWISVFSKLLKQADRFTIREYLEIYNETSGIPLQDIADVFLSNDRFEQAKDYFSRSFELEADKDKRAESALKAGYCLYKLKRFEEGVNWFERASANGYQDNDLAEFRNWADEQSTGN